MHFGLYFWIAIEIILVTAVVEVSSVNMSVASRYVVRDAVVNSALWYVCDARYFFETSDWTACSLQTPETEIDQVLHIFLRHF